MDDIFIDKTNNQLGSSRNPVGPYVGAINSNIVASNYLSIQTGGTVTGNVSTTSLFTNKLGIGTTTTSYSFYTNGTSFISGDSIFDNNIYQNNILASNIFLGKVGIGTNKL